MRRRVTQRGPERVALTVREAAELLGVSRATIYRWIKSGEMPTVRMSATGRVMIPRKPLLKIFGADA
jgi:excisionase family DNA binding protein